MAYLTNRANSASAMNGVGPVTYICTIATGASIDTYRLEIESEGGTIVGIEDATDGSYILVQGGSTPAVTGVTVVATIANAN